ncbi:MAG: arginase [Woeseia sp.]|nr:arginase [Woeseia sp.]|tara:strand:- start:530 stop:1738 length:1209 start_codon:yes stop_codon:yes gene_type:complete
MNMRFFSVLVTFFLFISFVLAQDELAGVDPEDKVIYLAPPDGPDALRDGDGDGEFNEADREPGLISLSRENWRRGVLSFFGLPVALTQEDLRAANVDVALMGAPVDMGVGLRGAGEGPRALRAAMRGTGGSNAHMHVGVAWKKELIAVDYGNSPIDILSVERSMPPVRKMVREIAETGAIPIIVGGDHSLSYPNVAGVADVYGKENVGVIHFDAHFDAGDPINGHLISHAQPVRRLVDDGHVNGKNYIQVGLRGYWPGEKGFNWMRENDMRYHTMAEIEQDGWDVVMDRIMNEALDGPEYLYISFDIDVLDPAYTPGTGTPESNGLTPREIFPLIRTLCSENQMVGFDLVELNPLLDPGYTTVMNSGALLQECLTGMAMRKKGIKERGYYNPLTVRDAQPDP